MQHGRRNWAGYLMGLERRSKLGAMLWAFAGWGWVWVLAGWTLVWEIERGAVVDQDQARFWIWLGAAVCALGFGLLPFAVRRWVWNRRRVALESEAANPGLMDRLNTLVDLAEKPAHRGPIFGRIQAQAESVLAGPKVQPYRLAAPCAFALACGAAALALWRFSVVQDPWRKLTVPILSADQPNPSGTFEIAAPPKAEPVKPWGELRITEPGRDLKLTKVDVLEFKLEAAAGGELSGLRWEHAVNGRPVVEHPLAAPAEKQYAAYTERLFLDELGLSDWDVLTYVARGTAEGYGALSSELYFVEIRPFRTELEKVEQAGGGKGGSLVREISELIEEQQRILRETARFTGGQYGNEEQKSQDRSKLKEAQERLQKAAQVVDAKLQASGKQWEMPEVSAALWDAGLEMGRAVSALQDGVDGAVRPEQAKALHSLIEARKQFHQKVAENPDQFSEDESGKQADPIATVLEIRNRGEETRKKLEALEARQSQLCEAAKRSSKTGQSSGAPLKAGEVARRQAEIAAEFAELKEQQARCFRGADGEVAALEKAMQGAETAAKNSKGGEGADPSAFTGLRLAEVKDRIQDLKKALARTENAQALERALRSREVIEQASKALCSGGPKSGQGDASNAPGGGGQGGADALQTMVGNAQQALQELGRLPAGAGLGEAVSGETGKNAAAKLEAAGKELKEGVVGGAGSVAAGKALGELLSAIDKALPRVGGSTAQASDPGAPEAQSGDRLSLDQAVLHLESLLKSAPGGPAQARLKGEALAGLEAGVGENAGNVDGMILKSKAARVLSGEGPADEAQLRGLLDAIEKYRSQLQDKAQQEAVRAELTRMREESVSPAYRRRVEDYFRKLSDR